MLPVELVERVFDYTLEAELPADPRVVERLLLERFEGRERQCELAKAGYACDQLRGTYRDGGGKAWLPISDSGLVRT